MTQLILLAILISCMTTVVAMSWTSKERQRDFIIGSVEAGVNYHWVEQCEDDHPKCNHFKKLCTKYKIVRKKCQVTCGLCTRAPAPPNCGITKYGCCWDNVTIAEGNNYKGCADCADKYSECKHFVDQCAHRPDLRLICPVTCNVGCKQCLDNPYQADVCVIYKKYNFCSISPDLMQKMCAKTCGFC